MPLLSDMEKGVLSADSIELVDLFKSSNPELAAESNVDPRQIQHRPRRRSFFAQYHWHWTRTDRQADKIKSVLPAIVSQEAEKESKSKRACPQ